MTAGAGAVPAPAGLVAGARGGRQRVGSARHERLRAVVRPLAFLRAALLLSMLGQIGRVPVLSSQGKDVPVLVHEIPLVAALALAAVGCARARRLYLDPAGLAALAFALVGALGTVLAVDTFGLSGYEVFVSLAYLARWLAYFGIYVVVLNAAAPDEAASVWRAVERGVLAFAAFGVVQSAFLPGFAQKVFPESAESMPWDWQGHRLVSTILDPNYAGGLILIPLLVLLARMASGEAVPRWKVLLLLAGLVATFSRSSILGLVVGGAVIVAARGVNRRMAQVGGLALLAALPALPVVIRLGGEYNKFTVRDGSALQRTVMWLRALTVFLDHPVLGVGFNTYGFVQRRYGWDIIGRDSFGVDGGLLFVAVMTGVVGLAVYVAMLALLWRRARALWRDPSAPSADRGTALGAAAVTAAIVVHSCFVNSLLLPFIMAPLWALWGVVALRCRAAGGARRAARAAARAAVAPAAAPRRAAVAAAVR